MSKYRISFSPERQERKDYFRRFFNLLLIFVMLLQLLPLQALAVWDGSGSTTDTGAGQVTGVFNAQDFSPGEGISPAAKAGR